MQLFKNLAIQLLAVLLVLHQQNVECEENSLGDLFGLRRLIPNFVKKEEDTTPANTTTNGTTNSEATPRNAAANTTAEAPKSGLIFPNLGLLSKIRTNLNLFSRNDANSEASSTTNTASNATSTKTKKAASNSTTKSKAKARNAEVNTANAETAPTNAAANTPANSTAETTKSDSIFSNLGLLSKIGTNKTESADGKGFLGFSGFSNLNLLSKNGKNSATTNTASNTNNTEAKARNADVNNTNAKTAPANAASNTTANSETTPTNAETAKSDLIFLNLGLFAKNGTSKTEDAGGIGGWFSNLPKRLLVFEDKKEEPLKKEQGWLSRFRANLISSPDLSEPRPAADGQSPKEASKANLPNLTRSAWELSDYNLTNLTNFSPNFTISNWELLLKWNSTGLLNTTNLMNFNSSKDWLENYSGEWFSGRDWLVGLKARYYGNLLNSSASDTSTTPPSVSQTTVSTPATNLSDEASMSIFRSRLLRVYDSLTFCEHPCNGKRVKKNANGLPTINGCGPSYFSERQLSMIPYGTFFQECCNAHDSNYSECGFKKQEADYKFLDCMLSLINRTSIEEKNSWPKIRKSFGYALFGMVDLFGCKAFAISQREVCACS